MSTIYWAGFIFAFIGYGGDRAIRWVRHDGDANALSYVLPVRILVASTSAAAWPAEATARLAIWAVRRIAA